MTRLDKVADRQTLRLTHYGRKTGKPHELTVLFVVDGERVLIGTANVSRQWVRNVQKTPRVGLSIGGEKFAGEARFLTDHTEHRRAQSRVRRKYWMF
jgi:deazaflavin-dependent oxidoreductase (nitroreductase family)